MINQKEWQLDFQNYYTPLETLLEIIKKSKHDLLNIDIGEITKQYLNFVNELILNANVDKQLDEIGEYLKVAQHLVTLKTKYLLQSQLNDDARSKKTQWTEKMLTELVLSIQKYKERMELLSQKQNERILMLNKEKSNFEKFIPQDFNYEKIPDSLDSRIFLKYLKIFENKLEDEKNENFNFETYEIIDIPLQIVEEKVIKYLEINGEEEFGQLFFNLYKNEVQLKIYFVSLFLAVLILYSENKIELHQQNDLLFLKLMDKESSN